MDLTQIALLIVAVNLGALALGFVVAGIRSVARRRRDLASIADRRRQRSTN